MLGADTSGSPPGRCPPIRQNQRRIVAAVLRMRCPQAPYTRAPRLALHELAVWCQPDRGARAIGLLSRWICGVLCRLVQQALDRDISSVYLPWHRVWAAFR